MTPSLSLKQMNLLSGFLAGINYAASCSLFFGQDMDTWHNLGLSLFVCLGITWAFYSGLNELFAEWGYKQGGPVQILQVIQSRPGNQKRYFLYAPEAEVIKFLSPDQLRAFDGIGRSYVSKEYGSYGELAEWFCVTVKRRCFRFRKLLRDNGATLAIRQLNKQPHHH